MNRPEGWNYQQRNSAVPSTNPVHTMRQLKRRALHKSSVRKRPQSFKGQTVNFAHYYFSEQLKVNEAKIIPEIHAAAKETVALAEERFMSNSHEWQFDNAWQEMLNHATLKVNFGTFPIHFRGHSTHFRNNRSCACEIPPQTTCISLCTTACYAWSHINALCWKHTWNANALSAKDFM